MKARETKVNYLVIAKDLVWFLLLLAMLVLMTKEEISSYKTHKACEQKCDIRDSFVIDRRCHCKTLDVWEPAK